MPGWAGLALVQGTFADDSSSALIPFSVTGTQLVTVQSYGYAGGIVPTLPTPTIIPSGGFAPNAYLFDGAGNEITSDNGGHCGITVADSTTGNCDDPYFQETLPAGFYTLAIVEWDNVSNGAQSDGFRQDGNPGFTCAEFGLSGNFCDVTTALGTPRNGNYAFAISGATEVGAVPEPATLPLAFVTCLLGFIFRARRFSFR